MGEPGASGAGWRTGRGDPGLALTEGSGAALAATGALAGAVGGGVDRAVGPVVPVVGVSVPWPEERGRAERIELVAEATSAAMACSKLERSPIPTAWSDAAVGLGGWAGVVSAVELAEPPERSLAKITRPTTAAPPISRTLRSVLFTAGAGSGPRRRWWGRASDRGVGRPPGSRRRGRSRTPARASRRSEGCAGPR